MPEPVAISGGSASIGRADVADAPAIRIVYLHMLGGSARHWDDVIAALPDYEHLPLNLPGYGGTAATATSVEGMARAVIAQLPNDQTRWVLVGHSMGAKVGLAVLDATTDTVDCWAVNLCGIVTLAGSPPGPEPMEDDQRATLTAYAAHGPVSHRHAVKFLDQNTQEKLTGPTRTMALDAIMATSPEAWVAWLQQGSREDWTARNSNIGLPALIAAGASDEVLGTAAQRRMMRTHFPDATVATVAGAKHILPLEQPQAVADLIAQFIATLTIPQAYRQLLTSPRVSTATRKALFARTAPDAPNVLSGAERATLSALIGRILPGAPTTLAATVENGLATGDGWRPAILPPDTEAYRTGLAALGPFVTLDGQAQDTLLASIETRDAWPGGWTAQQMQAWFGDVRDAAIRAYVSHPATLAQLRYSGVAYAGDGAFKPGFADPGLGGAEPWEP